MGEKTGLSLICATRNRTVEVARLFESLREQTSGNFELILVDQNEGQVLNDLVTRFNRYFTIIHLRQSEPNNSKARNFGTQYSNFNWIGFPDDDCWYPSDFIEKMNDAIEQGLDGVFINWKDPTSRPNKMRFQLVSGIMTIEEAFTLASAICLFLRKARFQEVGGFNEKLGLGVTTIIKAGEEQELTLRLLQSKAQIFKSTSIVVYHAMHEREWSAAFKDRISSQGACDFLFTRKYKTTFASYSLLMVWSLGLLYNLVRVRKRNFQWYWLKLRGALTAPAYE